MNIYRAFIALVVAFCMGCDPGLPGNSSRFQATGFAAPLTQTEFNNLTPVQQYEVANKLMGTAFRGISFEEFFDMNAGMAELQPQERYQTFLDDTVDALSTHASRFELANIDAVIDGLDAEGNPNPAQARYIFNSYRPSELPLARITEYPVSRDLYIHWMAYVLANTILFSPAEEMESTDTFDIQAVYRFLIRNLTEGRSVREIVRAHLPSLQRWRVSRSPENHALEAYELYLGLFETEQDSINGGIACRDLYLTPGDGDQRYQIAQTDFPNTEPQLILDTHFITTCNDLYDVIASHSLLMPRVIEVLMNYFLSGRPLDDRLRMIESMTNSNPSTFEDIFTGILFSREYLINTERPKSFEENMLPLLHKLHWNPGSNRSPVDEQVFTHMISNPNNIVTYMPAMGWASMQLKIGRIPDVPLDGLSFGNYHKGLREGLLLNSNANNLSYQGGNGPTPADGLIFFENGDIRPVIGSMTLTEYIDFLFVTALYRKPSTDEQTDLITLFNTLGHLDVSPGGDDIVRDNRHEEVTGIVYDYISRLPEFYYFRNIN